jgi:pimeloyl-ACP methyl ester carboxylesterase
MRHFDYGGTGLPLHFLHANGYPPACYKPLLELLKTEYRVFGMLLRPLWDGANPQDLRTWHLLSEDLLRFLTDGEPFDHTQGKPNPVIGVGHSIGAIVTLRAALRAPSRFRALALIDPVLFVPSHLAMWCVIRAFGLGDRVHPLIQRAKKRRRTFDDLETVFRAYRSRPVFRYLSDESLRAYIAGILKPSVNGAYELAYSPEWEAQIYRTGLHDFDLWQNLPKLEVPTLFIRGAETDTFLEEAARLVKKKQPKVRVEALEKSTHLLPLERPKEVFDILQSFLREEGVL